MSFVVYKLFTSSIDAHRHNETEYRSCYRTLEQPATLKDSIFDKSTHKINQSKDIFYQIILIIISVM